MVNPTNTWTRDEFFKSSFSEGNQQGCVGVALRRSETAVIDMKDKFSENGILAFSPEGFAAFRNRVVKGEFRTP